MSANIIEDATIDDLDPEAIRMAREKYAERHEKRAKEIEELLMDKLPEVLDETQKYNKVTNLLASLRKEGKIYVERRIWFLCK